MYKKNFLNLITSIAVIALAFSQFREAKAAKIDFGGEPEDNFWEIEVLYCKDGFSLTATQTLLGDGLPFWLELGSSTIPITGQSEVDIREPVVPPQPPVLARIAQGDGSSLVHGGQPFTVAFFFTSLQNAGTPITINIERWDHGNMTPYEVEADGSDESPNDDIETDNGVVGNCLVDTVAQSVFTTVNPATIISGGTSIASVSLNNVPAEGFTSAEFTCSYDPNVVETSNIQTTALFGADAAIAIHDPQNGNFIVAIAGSNGNKVMTSGTAFTFSTKGLQVGQSTIDCTARISKGDNILTPLPSSAAVLTILEVTPTPSGFFNGQVLALKPVTISLYRADTTLAASTSANTNGTFSLSVPAGSYTAVATSSGFLSAQGSLTVTTGNTATLPTISLLAGDIDNNNVIDQFDAMTIGMSYNTNTPPAADLNNDGTINVLDLELLARNYRNTGPVVWQTEGGDTGTPPPSPSFASDVMPIFQSKCSACHGTTALGGWNASSYQTVMESGDHAPVILPHDATNSLLVKRISGSQGTIMPPAGKLSDAEIQIITDWINAGALNN